MSTYANEITRGDTAGAQKPQAPPKYSEREGVAQARRGTEAHNKRPASKKNP